MNIRPEIGADIAAIRGVVHDAFGAELEADLIDRLRTDGDLLLSLVAEQDGRLVGHVGFSRVWIAHDGQRQPAVSLAPLAVIPSSQRRGIGGALVEDGHRRLTSTGETIAFVLGDPAYYGRFGYSLASAAAFDCAYAGPYFQALALSSAAPRAGAVSYAAAFGGLEQA